MADKPPLIDREQGRSVPRRARARRRAGRRDADRRRRRLELHLSDRARRRRVRASTPPASAAAPDGARHGARGGPAERDPSRGLRPARRHPRRLRGRERARRPVLRDATTSTGTWSRASCRRGSRPRRHATRSASTSSTHSSRSTRPTSRTPSSPRSRAPGSYMERQVRRFTQLWEINKTRELAAGRAGGNVARARTCPSRCRRPSCTATTASGT